MPNSSDQTSEKQDGAQVSERHKQFLPKVTFDLATLELETKLLHDFSDPDDRFSKMMSRMYPDLMTEVQKSRNDEEALAVCREFAQKVTAEEQPVLLAAKEAVAQDWTMVSDEFLRLLSEHMETPWPTQKNITGHISIMPICPRFLDTYSFTVNYRRAPAESRETIAHEIVHFLWFKKWKEVFPEHERGFYEVPHLVWRLSEIMDPIILQCHPRIKGLIQPKEWGYTSFKELKIGDVGMTEHFVHMYKECMQAGKSFGELLRMTWAEAEKHREVLEKF